MGRRKAAGPRIESGVTGWEGPPEVYAGAMARRVFAPHLRRGMFTLNEPMSTIRVGGEFDCRARKNECAGQIFREWKMG